MVVDLGLSQFSTDEIRVQKFKGAHKSRVSCDMQTIPRSLVLVCIWKYKKHQENDNECDFHHK